ncbi:unnamed protein product [Didymodactylos carnosus]|uniref:NHL repeat containing protein n=1 Tax=Didymodactylos carnosus TaxID=1234261 RepID=A0A815A8G4_9BILA|nr:unnamed protein product [Didymodactylos carnosus]CAF1253946.1 unnamed protein product [Didymodactylos carnosus]CAF3949266.1 unnamed protein product [Didymodactylos carnosus]CAF4025111.1 unnamed protein product [Didymodactylos carnosus]
MLISSLTPETKVSSLLGGYMWLISVKLQLNNNIASSVRIPSTDIKICPKAKWNQTGITIKSVDRNKLLSLFNFAFDSQSNIYIVNLADSRIEKYLNDTNFEQYEILIQFQKMYQPTTLFIDKYDNLYIDYSVHNRLYKISLKNKYNRIIYDNPEWCTDMYVDANENIYITENNNSRIMKWSSDGKQKYVIAGGNGNGNQSNQLDSPSGIYVSDQTNHIYIADVTNHRIQRWTLGNVSLGGVTVAGGNGNGNGTHQLNFPNSVIVDNEESVYIVDESNHRIVKWAKGAKNGEIIIGGDDKDDYVFEDEDADIFSSEGGQKLNKLTYPTQMKFDKDGNLYVLDWTDNRLQKFEIDTTDCQLS